jgi:acetyl-CoA carboxylase carboxyltransferase component
MLHDPGVTIPIPVWRLTSAYPEISGYAQKTALDWRLRLIRLLDATGGSVRTFEKIGRTYIPTKPSCPGIEQLLCTAPVVAAVLGSVAVLQAVEACLSHFSLMVKGTSQIFAGGPPVVEAAIGESVTKEELCDERSQIYEAGAIDNLVENEEEAFHAIRRFLSYLPDNVWKLPPRIRPADDPDRREEALLAAIPRESRKRYNPCDILDHVLDRGSRFEITPFYGRSRITALARINGYAVGAMINNPNYTGASMDVAAGTKVIRFLQLCDTFHLPMVYFADEPGFMVGFEAQRQGIVRAGARSSVQPCERGCPRSVSLSVSCTGLPDSAMTGLTVSSSGLPGRRPTGAQCTSRGGDGSISQGD